MLFVNFESQLKITGKAGLYITNGKNIRIQLCNDLPAGNQEFVQLRVCSNQQLSIGFFIQLMEFTHHSQVGFDK